MTSDGPPGHFVQGFWSPVWWPCFGDRRHKCSSTEFASARRTVNPCIICQKPWTEEFWTVFKHRWGQIFFAWHLQQIQGLWCLFELAAFLQKAGRHGNKPWLSGPWCLTVVVLGMRLIRRPWKGCQFWDVPFTIPWKGCKFQKWGLRKWGYRIWFFWVFNMLHMLSYDHQGGWGGVLTFLTNTSFTLRKMHTLRMLSYDHQGGLGVGGGVLTSLTSTSFTLRKMQTLHMLSVVSKIIPTKGSSWPKSTTNKISLLWLRLIIFEVVCGINPIEPLLLVLNKWMEHGNTLKNGDLRRCSTKKQNVHKKRYTWAYSWTWRHIAALLQTVASALPQALWHR